MSYLRDFGVLLAVAASCLTIGVINGNAQGWAHVRHSTGQRHQSGRRAENRRLRKERKDVEISRSHETSRPANLPTEPTGLKNILTYRSVLNDRGSGYTVNPGFPYDLQDRSRYTQDSRYRIIRTYDNGPQYDNYAGDLVIRVRSGINVKLRIGSGQPYIY